MNNIFIPIVLFLGILISPIAAADIITTSPIDRGFGVVDLYNAPSREIVIDGAKFKVHISTKVGQVVSWPGDYKAVNIDTIQKGDQVYFDADFSQNEPYKLEYLHRLVK